MTDQTTPHHQRPLGVALIGYAFMGKAHSHAWRNAAAFYDVPTFEQTVLVGRNQHELDAAAKRYGWKQTDTDWRSVINRPDIDIVDICTPGNFHAEIAIAALEAGKHVLVEKPLANSLVEATRMTQTAQHALGNGTLSMLGFNYRRVPALALARQMIQAQRLGTIRHIRASYHQDWLTDPSAPMSWRLRKETAGSGALGDIASHAIDQILFLTGSTVISASGKMQTFTPERPGEDGHEAVTVDDAVWATLELANGTIASVEASRVATGLKNSMKIEIFGETGSLMFDLERINELQFNDAILPPAQQGFQRILVTEPEHPYIGSWWPPGHVLGWEHTFTHQIVDLLQAIEMQVAPSPSFADGLAVQRILEAIEDSARRSQAAMPVTNS